MIKLYFIFSACELWGAEKQKLSC